MDFQIVIAPQERDEALEAYRDLLSAEQVEGIETAADDEWIVLWVAR